jgi:CRP-like cAMP-binding protein
VYFIKTGKIKIAVLNPDGKEAILAILASGNFFGEASIIGQPLRLHSATVQEPAHLVRFEKDVITEALDLQPRLAHLFIAHLVVRNTDLEEGLADRLLNRSEKRLARILLKLARSGEQVSNSIAKIGRVRHEDLAEMVGTTRPRITALMNKFRNLGFIDYKKEITVRADLLMNALLRE